MAAEEEMEEEIGCHLKIWVRFFQSPSAWSRISENFVDNFPIMLERKVGIFFLQISGVCKMVLRGEVGTWFFNQNKRNQNNRRNY